IILPDYKRKSFFISPRQSGRDYENGAFFELDLIELKQAYSENKLSGKLKELTASLDESKDNNIFLLFEFK
ncbi:MAG: 6-bladed beta-propeller, partial [Tannerella sp.]|nr:6-bladed beta-propeller [Tannerella sp.]